IAEQLRTRFREARFELVRRVDAEPIELVLRGPLQGDNLQVRIRFDRGANEAHLVARLAFEIEDLLASITYVDERLLRVVLLDLFAGLRRNTERERPR